jgi:hypothetical protein
VGKGQPARKANSLTATCRPNMQKTWDPRRLTPVQAIEGVPQVPPGSVPRIQECGSTLTLFHPRLALMSLAVMTPLQGCPINVLYACIVPFMCASLLSALCRESAVEVRFYTCLNVIPLQSTCSPCNPHIPILQSAYSPCNPHVPLL